MIRVSAASAPEPAPTPPADYDALLAEIADLLPAAPAEPRSAGCSSALTVDVSALRAPSRLAALVRHWRPEGERRAAASLWSKYLFRLMLPPVVLAQCRTRRRIVPTGKLSIHNGLPAHWTELTLTEGASHPADYFAPWVHALSESSGVRPRVLWGNIGNHLEALLTRLSDETPDLAPAARELMAQWLEQPHWQGGRNPLYRPVVYKANERLRRVCCLRYRLADMTFCTTCPCPRTSR